MTERLYLQDAYLATCSARVVEHFENHAIILDRTNINVNIAQHPADKAYFEQEDAPELEYCGHIDLGHKIAFITPNAHPRPPIGTELITHIDWPRRYESMRLQSAALVLSDLINAPQHFVCDGNAFIASPNSTKQADMPIETMLAQFNEKIAANTPIQEICERVSKIRQVGEEMPFLGLHISETEQIGEISLALAQERNHIGYEIRLKD